MRRFAILILVGAIAVTQLRGAGSPQMKRILSWHVVNGSDGATRSFARETLKHPSHARFATSGKGLWVIATPDGVLAEGKFYDVHLGANVRVAMKPDGTWLAAGKAGAVNHGREVARKETAKALHDDMYKWRYTRVGGAPPGALPFAAGEGSGPGRPPRGPLPLIGADGGGTRIPIIKDTTPPQVRRVEIIRFPNDPNKIQVLRPPNIFVGAEEIEIRVTMSEKMGAAPRVLLTQATMPAVQANLVDEVSNPVYRYRWYPNTAPQANGPVKLEVKGEKDGNPPDYGYDLAGNPIQEGSPNTSYGRGALVDSLPPDLKRVDISIPGNMQSIPSDGETLAGHEFPSSIMVFVEDYDQPDDGTFAGANIATDNASGVDYDRIRLRDGTMDLRLFDPNGREIKGTLVVRRPALELLLPDVYDPALGIFPDRDSDGKADPIEGNYRVEVNVIDKVGNSVKQTAILGMDSTPIFSKAIDVSINPVFTEPFPNPINPIGQTGTAVKKLEALEITSADPDWDINRSTAKLLSYVPGNIPPGKEMKTTLTREDGKLILSVDRDQNGDGKPDFENPPMGQYVPPGGTDPRWGKNDGVYIVEVKASDKAGNVSTLTRNVKIDTTAPQVQSTFPSADVTIGPPLRLVDAILHDPTPTSGAEPGGINYKNFLIKVDFQGNEQTPQQQVNGVGFVHAPNNTDPTIPSYNPTDTHPKLLFEFTDESGHVVSLPDDGSWDGVYTIQLTAYDNAGNEVNGSVGFTYSSTASSTPTATVQPMRITLRR